MTRVKGLIFLSLFSLALTAQPVLAQDRNSDPPPPTSRGSNADAPAANPQTNPTAKPRRQRGDGSHQGHRRHRNGDPAQAQGSSGSKRQGLPPGSSPQNGDTTHN